MHCNRRNSRFILGTIIVLLVLFFLGTNNNFAKSGGIEFLVQQLHQFNTSYPTLYSTVGMVTYTYTPQSNSYFINIIARDTGGYPQWIVRNLYIPNNSWIDRTQSISARFCLMSLGFLSGNVVEKLEMAFFKSDTCFSVMPKSEVFSPMEVDTLRDDAEGIDTDIPGDVSDFIDCPQFPEFKPGEQIKPIEFRGCRVPNIDLDDKTFPDTEEYAGDQNACGPASAANSLEWLDSVSTDIDIPEPLRTTMEELSKFMKRPRNGGVTIDNFVRGKLDFIEAHKLPINVKFQSTFLKENVKSSSGLIYARNDNDGKYPTWEWLKQQMDGGEDVEIMYYWWDGEIWRGHAVVVTGVEESEDGTKKSLKFKHDVWQGRKGGTKQEAESIYIDSFGRMVLRFPCAFIGNAVAESPGDPYPTPVELGLFTAKVVNKDVCLEWQTETESNNYGFEIFRNAERIAFVKGHGTVSEPQSYTFVDEKLDEGTYRYSLVQIDFDGTRETVGKTSAVVLNNPTQFILSQNYPNPFNGTTKISYSIPENCFVSIQIFNMMGEKIVTLVNEQKEAGVYAIDFDATRLANGIYFYRLDALDFSQIRKFLLLK